MEQKIAEIAKQVFGFGIEPMNSGGHDFFESDRGTISVHKLADALTKAYQAGVDEERAKAQTISVKTPIGDIVAEKSGDYLNYPGVYVSLQREDCDLTLALVEYTTTEADAASPSLITRVWGRAEQEDYTDRIIHSGFEKKADTSC